jgi:hypothetical protein
MARKKTTVKKTKVKQKQNVNVRVVVNSNNKRKTVRLGRSQQQQQERQQQQPTNFPQVIQVPQFIDRPTQTGFDTKDIISNVKQGLYEVFNEAQYNEDMIAQRQNLKDADAKAAVKFSSKQDPSVKDEPKEKDKQGFQEKESQNTGISVSVLKRMLDSVVKKDPKDDDLEPQTPSSPRIPQFNLDGAGRGAKLVSQATSAVPFKDIGMIRSFLVDIKKYSSKAKAMKLKTIPGREMLENDQALRQQYVDWWNNRAK